MKLVVTTTYDGIDEDWLSWYCQRLSKDPNLFGVGIELLAVGHSHYNSRDPSHATAKATTTYEVKREENLG